MYYNHEKLDEVCNAIQFITEIEVLLGTDFIMFESDSVCHICFIWLCLLYYVSAQPLYDLINFRELTTAHPRP